MKKICLVNLSTEIDKMFVVVFVMMFLLAYANCYAQITLFEDDFEDGNAIGWELESGWQVEDDNGNYVLSGVEHSRASSGDILWKNYSLKVDVKLLDENSATHLNFRNNGRDPAIRKVQDEADIPIFHDG